MFRIFIGKESIYERLRNKFSCDFFLRVEFIVLKNLRIVYFFGDFILMWFLWVIGEKGS